MRLVMVHWKDIHSASNPWIDCSDAAAMKPIPMITVGWILEDRPDCIVVAGTRSNDDSSLAGDVNCIPKGCISLTADLGIGQSAGTGGPPPRDPPATAAPRKAAKATFEVCEREEVTGSEQQSPRRRGRKQRSRTSR